MFQKPKSSWARSGGSSEEWNGSVRSAMLCESVGVVNTWAWKPSGDRLIIGLASISMDMVSRLVSRITRSDESVRRPPEGERT